jgi:signal transduction histidine kinase
MVSSGSSFRVLKGGNPQVSGNPGFVIYRLDPGTLEFTEIRGNPERLLGFPLRDWFRARFWSGRLHPDDRAAAREFFRGWASAWRDEQLEYRVIDAAGRTVWVHQIICVERDARQEAAICGALIDITERMSRETEVETALFLKSELFRIIVEELAPPVRAISIYGDMLGRHLAAQGDDVGSDYAVGLRDGLERLDTTLAHLMRLAQSAGASAGQMNGGLNGLHRGSSVG